MVTRLSTRDLRRRLKAAQARLRRARADERRIKAAIRALGAETRVRRRRGVVEVAYAGSLIMDPCRQPGLVSPP